MGWGFGTEVAPWLLSDGHRKLAREKMDETARQAEALLASLPVHRDLLMKIRRYGLQKI